MCVEDQGVLAGPWPQGLNVSQILFVLNMNLVNKCSVLVYMLQLIFLFQLIFVFLCFKFISIHYHTPKQWENKKQLK